MSQLITTGVFNILSIILTHTGLAESTRSKYCRAVEGYLATGSQLTDASALAAYAAAVSPSVRGNLKSALRLWVEAVSLKLKGAAMPDTVHEVQAALWRLEAMNEAIQSPQLKGQKTHTWLSQQQVRDLLRTCSGADLQCRRDKVVLGMLVGAGLRREELVNLEFKDMKFLSIKERLFRTVLSIKGKGAKNRSVPIGDKLAAHLEAWRVEVGPGRIARALDQRGDVQPTISPIGIFNIVNRAGAEIKVPGLAPHDLRRTYAEIGRQAGVPITQISKLLGHESVATTQRYLNMDLDLESTIGDYIPFD